ncbi:MAG: hydroxyacid dehydrogenase [Fretibacterium sp.]|nr:hydroxyacid dehydrogenase [Fretibacterium sp.]
MRLNASILESFPKMDEAAVDALLAREIEASSRKIVVLDDDPTGVQTVHDVPVYTGWDHDSVLAGFREKSRLFYILTNSRGFTAEQTTRAHHEIAAAVDAAAREAHCDYLFISRSDSTLRGHYPLETKLLKEDYEKFTGKTLDGEILCPFFKEGGRFTIDNVHYVKYGDELVPACETEFARDKTFGYSAATMPDYVEEKTGGEYRAGDVTCISLEDIRAMNYDKIEAQLMAVRGFSKIIVNAVDYPDIKVFCVALFRAMKKGRSFMFRSAAALVKVMGGVTDQPLLTRDKMVVKETSNGGVIVVGSHTARTTEQLEKLKELGGIEFIELNASLVKDSAAFTAEVERCLKIEEACLKAGKTVCCYTTRTLITADTGDREDELRLSVKISDAVQSLVGRLTVTPAFVIAKGGITSSDVGVKALGVKRANVLGQIRPGIPVWQTGPESKFPMTPYVIFPGNVGTAETLKEAVEILTSPAGAETR